jgi:hypothetical protein
MEIQNEINRLTPGDITTALLIGKNSNQVDTALCKV